MKNFELVRQLEEELTGGYERYVATVARATGASGEDAREALHTAAWKMLARFRKRCRGNSVKAWPPYIINSAINELLKERLKRRSIVLFSELDPEERKELLAIPDPRLTPAEEAEKNEIMAIAWSSAGALPPVQRQVVVLRCSGHSFGVIGATLGMLPSTARGLWCTGIAKLRRHLRRVA